ncbi:MAG: type II toxin-antitoxin system VapC family toxin [Acidimicrobiia bacterium]
MIVLDTNVISELMRNAPHPPVVTWVDSQIEGELFTTAVTLAELLYDIARLPVGDRRASLSQAFHDMVAIELAGRVLAFDDVAAEHYADIVVTRQQRERPISMADAQIAAICRSHGAVLATRNTIDFAGLAVDLSDPWGA